MPGVNSLDSVDLLQQPVGLLCLSASSVVLPDLRYWSVRFAAERYLQQRVSECFACTLYKDVYLRQRYAVDFFPLQAKGQGAKDKTKTYTPSK